MDNLIGSTKAVFTVSLSVAVSEIVQVDWSTRDGTAKSGIDYEATMGVVSFSPGETTKQFEVVVYGQEFLKQDDKNFFVSLSPPNNAALSSSLLECIISVDDGVSVLSIVVPQGKRGFKGDPGLSAYEQAVLSGSFVGTIEEWLREISDASQAADRSKTEADRSELEADRAAIDALKAKASATSASFMGNIFPSPEAGVDPVTGVLNSAYYNVRSPLDENYLDEYQNVDGVPIASGKSYPSAERVNSLESRVVGSVESIDGLIAIKNPKDGQTVFAKSYRSGWAVEYPYMGPKGGGYFIFDSSKVSFTDVFDRVVTNDKGRFINGWVRQVYDNEFTPEMFGAYGEAERLGRDDWQAIEDMFQSLMPCGTGTNMSWSEIGVSWNRGQKRVVRLDSLYKHSKTLFIPPNITIKQTNRQDPQSRKITQGFWYSPNTSDRATTCAVSNYVYSKVDPTVVSLTDAKWYLNKDIMFVPAAGAEGNTYYAFGWNIDLDQLTIITDQDVALGLRFINVHSKTKGLSIGGYIDGVSYQNPKIPRVGMVHFDSYVSTHDDTHIRADVQAIVTAGSNAGVVFNGPWLTQSNRKQKSSAYIPLYKTNKHTETGSIAITYLGSEAHFNNPVYENWNIHVLAIDSPYVSIYRPHNESLVLKHEFYMINSSMNCELKSSFGHYTNTTTFTDYDGSVVSYPKYSAVYVKDCLKHCGIRFTGLVRYGTARLINGENSGAVVELNYLMTSSLTPEYGRIGKVEFVRKANWGTQGYKTLIINPSSGSDDNNGLSYTNPRKTLDGIDKLVDDFGIETVVQMGDLTLDKTQKMPKSKFLYTGSGVVNLEFATFTLNFTDKINATFENLFLKQSTGVNPLFRCDSGAIGSLLIRSNFSTGGGALLRSIDNCNIDILVNNTSGQAGAYFHGAGSNNIIGVSSKGTTLTDKLVGGVNTKYIFESTV